jgi:hypothetical protein
MSPKPRKDKDEPEVTCPVCAGIVTLDDPFCPHCGAEFEEEEVEEIMDEEVPTVEVVPESADALELPPEDIEETPEIEALPSDEPIEAPFDELPSDEFTPRLDEPVEILEEEESKACEPLEPAPKTVVTTLSDLKVIGIAILILGIVGGSVMFNIRWLWTWVPSIEHNLVVYGLIGLAVIIVAFILFKKMTDDSEKKGKAPMHPMLPSVMLALIQFGFYATIMFVLYKPINNILRTSSVGMGAVFLVLAIVGLVLYLYDTKYLSDKQKDKA